MFPRVRGVERFISTALVFRISMYVLTGADKLHAFLDGNHFFSKRSEMSFVYLQARAVVRFLCLAGKNKQRNLDGDAGILWTRCSLSWICGKVDKAFQEWAYKHRR